MSSESNLVEKKRKISCPKEKVQQEYSMTLDERLHKLQATKWLFKLWMLLELFVKVCNIFPHNTSKKN